MYSEAPLSKPVDCVLYSFYLHLGVNGSWWFIAFERITDPSADTPYLSSGYGLSSVAI